MAQLDIKLLGTFQATIDGELLTGFRSDKTRALLVYLALERARPHRRNWLATLLWGDYDDRSARRSLSSALANLRHLLAPLGATVTLQADRNDVWLEEHVDAVAVDVIALRQLLAFTETHTHRSLIHCETCIEQLVQANDLYKGPFLPGLTFTDSPVFDEWQRTQQEVLHQQALRALDALSAHHLIVGRYGQAETYARRQINLQPWYEEAHRQLMWALAGAGQRNAALAQYEICRGILAEDLKVEPEERTRELYQRIRSGAPLSALTWPGNRLTNPYRGLQSFREDDAADFFGRDSLTNQLVEVVRRRSLAALIGSSGSGKSSVLHAGLIHHLCHAARSGAAAAGWVASSMTPTAWTICRVRPGGHPFHALAAGMAPLMKPDNLLRQVISASDKAGLMESLVSGEVSLPQLAHAAGADGAGLRLLLVLDQFEELWTLCADLGQRQAFIDLLVAATSGSHEEAPLSVLLAVRADFMGQVLSHRALADALQDGVLMLGPMTRRELEEAIVKPAHAQGIRLQDGLAARMLNDVGDAPGRLPLLEFALTQLWRRQVDGVLTHEAYEAIGQVGGALAGHAEQVYALMSPTQQTAARRIFTQMVQIGQDTDDARRPISASEVNAEDWALLQHLADQRLVVTDVDPHGQQIKRALRGHVGPVAGVAISPDSRTIASGSFDNTIILWDAFGDQPRGEPLLGHANWVISLAFSPDGRTLASGSADTTIRLWNVATGAPIGQALEGQTGWVTGLAWSFDGATLISGSQDGTVRLWDPATGQEIGQPFTGHQTSVWSVLLNPADGGRSLYSGDNNGTVIWWDLASRQVLGPPLRSGIETESMTLSPDGSVLAIASFGSDGMVSLWRRTNDHWERRGCAIANRDLTSEERDRYLQGVSGIEICPPH